jgi:hypothetical protein
MCKGLKFGEKGTFFSEASNYIDIRLLINRKEIALLKIAA